MVVHGSCCGRLGHGASRGTTIGCAPFSPRDRRPAGCARQADGLAAADDSAGVDSAGASLVAAALVGAALGGKAASEGPALVRDPDDDPLVAAGASLGPSVLGGPGRALPGGR